MEKENKDIKKPRKQKKSKVKIKNYNLDKYEYMDILCSNSAHPEDAFKRH